jgi:DegV family protein with EDD domain
MTRVHVVTDSTADLPAGLVEAEGLDITIVPLNVHFGAETFRDKIDLTNEEFFRRLATSPVLPTTSQPAVGDFEAAYRRLAADGGPIVSIHISSRLSGTYQAARLAAGTLGGEGATVAVVDSLNTSLGLGFLVIAAARQARAGAGLAEIVAQVERMVPQIHLVFLVDTLEYLQRGGRIGRAQALLGSLLSIKPILRLDEGQVVPLRRERTRARALDALVAVASDLERVTTLGVIHSGAPADARTLAERLAPAVRPPLTPEAILISEFGPVVGTHTGPGAVGFVAYTGPA